MQPYLLSKDAPLVMNGSIHLKTLCLCNDQDPLHLSCFAICSLGDHMAGSNELKY